MATRVQCETVAVQSKLTHLVALYVRKIFGGLDFIHAEAFLEHSSSTIS
jgi:hypothetical protein